jgi:hypothetical protein
MKSQVKNKSLGLQVQEYLNNVVRISKVSLRKTPLKNNLNHIPVRAFL